MDPGRQTLCLAMLVAVACVALSGVQAAELKALRVCADPDNLPFSNRLEEGFENRIVALVAEALGVPYSYTWWPQRRGFLRGTLNARLCDVVIGIPTGHPLAQLTAPNFSATNTSPVARSIV